MKCYEFDHRKVSNGITVTTDEKFGKIIFLGIDGPKSKALKIAMAKNNPAIIKNGRMIDACPRIIKPKVKTPEELALASPEEIKNEKEKDKRPFVVFQKPQRPTDDIILRINTSSSESNGNINGAWRVSRGEPEKIFTVNGRRGNSVFCDDIVHLIHGEGVIVNLENDDQEFEIKNLNGKAIMTELVQK